MEKNSTNHRPLILVTNDDGVEARGLKALIEVVRPFGDLLVVASDQPMSGMSHAITVKYPLYLTKVTDEPGLEIYKTNGTPADCIKLAMNSLLEKKPDFVVSGINHGTNSSVSMHYSGTIGGAREGALHGIPAIGFSLLDHHPEADFSNAIHYCREIFSFVLSNGMEQGICYNVNVPKGKSINGIKVCRQAKGVWVEEFDKRIDPRGRTYYWLTGHFRNNEPESTDTDEWALNNGYVSVVPCTIDSTHQPSLEHLKSAGLDRVASHQIV
ncbi:5'/3'-nucleotidase SurE [Natronoflexus pectinivorans]|uniref:5'-nucleotidase SurE n=1 Tax=Natronoflexus pectinivorans TaxID=682526 RepID=A0A4R2GGE7_9BACT|nr:5'/3'-nucleotidase SurE [Natronoflexus pectinivorans]TCO07325.1 5'-nucleotidase /3'-nucleotidase /exopolyphosphatase [Natronoflexus pectinivorans]